MKIIFDKSLAPAILNAFGKAVSEEGLIFDKSTKKLIFTPEGEEIHKEEFAGIIPGSEIYLKSDIVSLIKYVENNPHKDK
ncbi:MAG: hypothetical protein AAB656_01890 [Patescibacteria group bacterium]